MAPAHGSAIIFVAAGEHYYEAWNLTGYMKPRGSITVVAHFCLYRLIYGRSPKQAVPSNPCQAHVSACYLHSCLQSGCHTRSVPDKTALSSGLHIQFSLILPLILVVVLHDLLLIGIERMHAIYKDQNAPLSAKARSAILQQKSGLHIPRTSGKPMLAKSRAATSERVPHPAPVASQEASSP